MGYLYENAAAVLILDEWLRQIPSTAPTPAILARTYKSNWIKRLWTHQEGFFPKELWVQFSDRAIKMQDISDKAWAYEKEMIPKGACLRFPGIASGQVAAQYGFFKFGYKDIRKDKGKIWMLYGPLADIMRLRRTTRQGDETVCLATILGLDLDPYQAIDDKPDADAAKKRMEIFLKEINRFQMGIIFNNWERLETEGFGWAPKSLLSHRGGVGDSEIGVWDQRQSDIQWDGNMAGLPVQYPGFNLFNFSKATRMSVSSAERAFAVQLEQGDNKESSSPYVVEVYRNDVVWDNHSRYAVILAKMPEDNEEGVLAAIGHVSTITKGAIVLRHLCLARVRWLKNETPEWIDTVTSVGLAKDTKWLVR
jgi:hypothetical protein